MVDSSSILPLLYSTLAGSAKTGTSQSAGSLGTGSFNNLFQQYMLGSLSGGTSSGVNTSSLLSGLFSGQNSSSSNSLSSLMQTMGLSSSRSSSLFGLSSTSSLFSNSDLFSSSGLYSDGYSSNSSLLSALASSGTVSASDISQLSTLSMLSSLSSMGLSDDSGDSNSNSFFSTDFMAPVISTLVKKLVERQTKAAQNALAGATSGAHINQFKAELEAGGDGVNQNCGPASLAMALHSLGLKVKGETSSSTQQEVISLARASMVNDTAKLDENTATNLEDIIRGVKAAGANASKLTANAENVQAALQMGGKVVISGTFEGKSPLPWTGDGSTDSKTAPGGAADHIVTVTAYNALTGKFTVDDPARNTSISVNASTLEYFMKGNAGAVAVFS